MEEKLNIQNREKSDKIREEFEESWKRKKKKGKNRSNF